MFLNFFWEKDVSQAFEMHFSGLKDPRIKRKKLYPLMEILFVVLCGTICGAERNIFHMPMEYHQRIHLQDYLQF